MRCFCLCSPRFLCLPNKPKASRHHCLHVKPRKPSAPDFHSFTNKNFQQRLWSLWRRYCCGRWSAIVFFCGGLPQALTMSPSFSFLIPFVLISRSDRDTSPLLPTGRPRLNAYLGSSRPEIRMIISRLRAVEWPHKLFFPEASVNDDIMCLRTRSDCSFSFCCVKKNTEHAYAWTFVTNVSELC